MDTDGGSDGMQYRPAMGNFHGIQLGHLKHMTLSIGPTGSFVFFLGRGRGNVQVENIRAPASTSPFAEEKPFQGPLVGRFGVCPSDGPLAPHC